MSRYVALLRGINLGAKTTKTLEGQRPNDAGVNVGTDHDTPEFADRAPSADSFTAAFDRDTGNLLANSLRLDVPVSTTGFNEVRFSSRGSGGMAADGRFFQTVLFDDARLPWGRYPS
jgi:hypothetical protein